MREMKDSGIEWIGTIPKNWKLLRIQYGLYEIKENNTLKKTSQVLSLVKDNGVMLYEDKGNKGNKSKEDISQYKIAYPNTLIVNSMNILIGSVGISKYTGCVSPVYYVFKETEQTDLRFINYIFNTREFQKELRKFANGILEIRLRVSANDIFRRKIPFPDRQTQKVIADFLDRKCSEIDALTADIQTQIDTLEEYKKSVITEAVTKGLDHNAEMKDSGVEWIGKIPKHWLITKLKRFCYFKTGTTPKTSNPLWFDGSLKWYTPSDFSENYILEDSSRTLTYKAKQDNVATIIPKNTVIIIGIGGTAGKIGLTVEECSCNQQLTAIISQHVHHKYLMYWMVANSCFLKETALYTTLPIINNRTLAEYLLIFPEDLSEQIKISDYLDNKCIEIKKIISEKRQQLETLAEYKKSLIYEYVTGKKEVA